jgi:hypothetical protein
VTTMNKDQPQAAHLASSNVGTSFPEAPSDLELMQYFDGELEEPRMSAVAAFVGADLGARGKLAGLQITSAIVQDQTRAASAADDIADLVMARLAAETATVAAPAGQVLPFPASTPVATAKLGNMPARPAANDNAKRIFGIAAFAVAAAAALTLWARFDTGPSTPLRTAPVAVMTAPAAPASPDSAEPEVDAVAVTPDGDMEHGVEVAAVNFGAHMGSIFYVPSDSAIGARSDKPGSTAIPPGSVAAQRTTTVVWLTDDAGE